jgi:PAS domain S-box-containing protein
MSAPFASEQYRTLFESLDQGFCTIEVIFDEQGTAVDYRFLEVNPAFERHTGLHDAVGRRMREMVPAHEAHWFRIYGQVAATGETMRFEQEAAAMGRWFEVFAVRVGDPKHRRVAVLFTDATARRRAEQALQASESRYRTLAHDHAAARREAEQASRAKDEFLAMLGHELRNPLAPILTALQLMRMRGNESREQEVLERQVRHLTRLVDDLLDVSRIARGTIDLDAKPIELRDVVDRAMELASPLLEQRENDVDIRVPPRALTVNADRDRLAQVVANLLTNASKYSSPRSRIVITGERHNGTARLAVRDDGVGIAPEMLASVFDAFVQDAQSLERAHGGLGLGLAIVRSLVAAHGGAVYAHSEGVGRGSEFVVELPAVDLPITAPDSSTAMDVGYGDGRVRRKVLVVDDNADAAHMLRDALALMGYDVEIACDGSAALTSAEAFRPDTVLLDIGLPVMDGYEVARRLQAHSDERSPVHLVALTGYGQSTDRDRTRDAGFHHHLVKPIDLKRLRYLIEHPEADPDD